MLINQLTTSIDLKFINLSFEDKKVLLLSGTNGEQILFTMECLLANDFTPQYAQQDASQGYAYKPFSGLSSLQIGSDGGILLGTNLMVQKRGKMPQIFCVRSVGTAYTRCFLISDEDFKTNLSDKLSASEERGKVERLITTFNELVGYQALSIFDESVTLYLKETEKFTIELQKYIYVLFESILKTPAGYKTVVLLSYIDELSDEDHARLIEMLCTFSCVDCVFSTADIGVDNFSDSSQVSVINV